MTASALSITTRAAEGSAIASNALRRWESRLRPLLVPAALLTLWEVCARSGLADPRFLPTLEAVAKRGMREFAQGGLAADIAASLERDLLGFAAGGFVGVCLGLSLGFSRPLERALSPLLLAHRQIALFAWVPLISMWFGGGEGGKVAFIALAAFQPALINTWQGIAGIPAAYRELARALAFNGWDFAVVVALPGALPRIFAGVHAALIYSWTSTIGAELLLDIAPGVGGRMNEGQHLFRIDLLFLCVIILGVVGVAFNLVAGVLERRWLSRSQA